MSDNAKIILTEYKGYDTAFLFDGYELKRLFLYKQSDINVNDIYIGRVSAVKKNLNAVFVEFAPGVNGFLPFDKINENALIDSKSVEDIKQGNLILVQVEKDRIKTKEFSLTTDISLPGTFSVTTLFDKGIHYSSKLSKDVICSFNANFKNKEYECGFIVRTNSANASFEDLDKEISANSIILSSIFSVYKSRVVFSKLYSARSALYNQVISIDESLYSEILTDNERLYDEFKDCKNIHLYNDNLPLKTLYSYERAFELATGKKVYLKTGGFLVIEPTEALTVIDVNSGKYDKKTDRNRLIKDTNIEAVYEIARQLSIRNISGIILVDFINIDNKNDKDELISLLKKELRKDNIKTSFVDITSLGLVEITREKKYSSIYDILKNNN